MAEPGPSTRRAIASPTETAPVSKGRRGSGSMADLEPPPPRLPQAQYRGSNGFNMTSPSAFDEFQVARFALHSLGSAFPSISELREDASAAMDTPEAVKKRIGAVKAAHETELNRAHAFANEAVLDVEQSHWLQFELDALPGKSTNFVYNSTHDHTPRREGLADDNAKAAEAMREYLAKEGVAASLAMQRRLVERAGSDLVERVSYAQLQSLMALWKSDKEIERAAHFAQMVADTRFPATIEQFNSIYNQGDKLRIARFLAAPQDQQEQMRYVHSWGAETAELMREYHTNAGFRASVDRIVRQVQTSDPRRR